MQPVLLLGAWIHDRVRQRLRDEFPSVEVIDGVDPKVREQAFPRATIYYGFVPVPLLANAPNLRWVQLSAAGVPFELCDALRGRDIVLTNLAGLYGPTIAEHTLALMLVLARQMHVAAGQQREARWHRDLADQMRDLAGRTLAIIGLGNIGTHIARLGKAFGMRVIGCRRTERPTPDVDQVFPRSALHAMLAEADVLAVAAPLTRETNGMLGPAEFAALRPGTLYVNISRGAIAQEAALVEALRSGRLGGAGLDVFAVEPLAADHALWKLPNVVITPHYSGETVNRSAQPGELLLRNLHAYMAGRPVGRVVDRAQGY